MESAHGQGVRTDFINPILARRAFVLLLPLLLRQLNEYFRPIKQAPAELEKDATPKSEIEKVFVLLTFSFFHYLIPNIFYL